jgi:hypothetical protein
MTRAGRFGKYGDYKRKVKLRQARLTGSLVRRGKEASRMAKIEKPTGDN